MRLLIVDDEPLLVKAVSRIASEIFPEIEEAGDAETGIAKVRAQHFDVLLADVHLPGESGERLVAEVLRDFPAVLPILMTGDARVDAAVRAMRAGAFDYIEKGFAEPHHLACVLRRAAEVARLRRRNAELEAKATPDSHELVGQSPPMRAAIQMIASVARSTATVLIEGESGTGKELAARAIHRGSPRASGPFVAVNCAALSDNLLESELFGHVKGAFTGADQARAGLFETANGGTIFLDEIGHISQAAQVRLLRVLQEGEIRRVGANHTQKVDVRVLAATNADLPAAIRRGEFRQDLYYRLNVVSVRLPPLRERGDDIIELACVLLQRHSSQLGKKVRGFSDAALAALRASAWPGNVRELDNAVQRGLILAEGELVDVRHLPAFAAPVRMSATRSSNPTLTHILFAEGKRQAVADYERTYVLEALAKAKGSISQASRVAGIDRTNFKRLMRAHGIEGPGTEGHGLEAPAAEGVEREFSPSHAPLEPIPPAAAVARAPQSEV